MSGQTVKKIIDIAVIKQEFADAVVNNLHSIDVDLYPDQTIDPSNPPPPEDLYITAEDFKRVFYPSPTNKFAPVLISTLIQGNTSYQKYLDILSLGSPKTINGQDLEIAEQVLQRIESGLAITRDLLTPCSVINLTTSLQQIKYFSNVTSGNNAVSCSLDWSQITSLVKSLTPPNNTEYEYILQITLVLNPTTMPSSTSNGVQPFSLVYQFNVQFDLTAI